MALIHSFEKSGNLLFKFRGQIPVVLFLLAIPVLYFTNFLIFDKVFYNILTFAAIFISFLGFVVRAYTIGTTPKGTSGRNTQNQVAESLNENGIYSMVRHPLYLGNYLMWIGIVMFTFNIYFFFIVSLAFWLYYERIMFAEERFLERKFGEAYLNWSQKVPAFIPRFNKFRKSSVGFSMKSVLRREYSGILATVAGFTFIDLLRIYFLTHEFIWQRTSVYLLIASFILALILRTIKHQSKWLDEEGRS
jgi:protein-S-isoprenylcysteine O-methyltransferase Ste14